MKELTIGTSGFTYSSGRKGESLYGQLAHDEDLQNYKFVASGRGWPVPTKGYSWGEMEKFYQSLDLYICTSTVEGIGYGPIEAMACGIPVVVPKGVGVFDELPDLENIDRYVAGNYDDLKRATLQAIDKIKTGAINKLSLISAVNRYTDDAWVNDYVSVFEEFLYGVKDTPPIHEWSGYSCIVYVSYGDQALECAVRAIKSAKKFLPQIKVVLISEVSGLGEDIHIYHTDDDIGARSVKTMIYDLIPNEFEYVLYLDADTEIISEDVYVLLDFLQDGWDWVMCINPAQYVLTREMARPDNKEEIDELFVLHGTDEMLQLNGGVFAFRRNDKTRKVMTEWHKEWNKYGKRDQAAFDRAYYNNPLKLYVLGEEFNTITRYTGAARSAGILHYPLTARRYRGRINGRLDSTEAWASIHPSKEEFAKWKRDNNAK